MNENEGLCPRADHLDPPSSKWCKIFRRNKKDVEFFGRQNHCFALFASLNSPKLVARSLKGPPIQTLRGAEWPVKVKISRN